MASITDIRAGLATALAAVPGLRTTTETPDTISPPVAIINVGNVNYDTAGSRGLDEYNFVLTVIVGRVGERSAQRLLDSYVTPAGASSVKLAIELDRTLGGKCDSLRVTDMRNYGSLVIGEITYLAAEFNVVVYAQ
ncbi:hypothetical protein UFOVP692_53 [uncultured Caudovirales phage]|jgi:hypothetical protein|uniref:Tail completion protein n=1 Tax=uncultured Caudovirales phage TaxID=2100421 RepID=A0A6J5NRW2_9CAUD|nr:hypothetical protein UFOVP692_53 [uncultured Caudovirales phage]